MPDKILTYPRFWKKLRRLPTQTDNFIGAALQLAAWTAGARGAALATMDSDGWWRYSHFYGLPDIAQGKLMHVRLPLQHAVPTLTSIETGELFIRDYAAQADALPELIAAGTRSLWYTPLHGRKAGNHGILALEWNHPLTKPPIGWQRQGLRLLAEMLALAMESGEAQKQARRMTRLYDALAAVQRAVIGGHEGFFAAFCKAATQQGGFPLAWVGVRRGDVIEPMAHAGRAADFVGEALGEAPISADRRDETGRSPAAEAWRRGELVVVNDFITDTRMAPWRAAAIKYGLQALAAVPVRIAGRVEAVLVLYEDHCMAFGPRERDLLTRFAEDIAFGLKRRDEQRQISHQATHDMLTGLPNRELALDRLTQGAADARRRQRLMAVGILDLDGFKQINDLYGHGAGDVLLQTVAERLRPCIRDSDTLARLGGDEFLIVLPGLECDSVVLPIIDRLLAEIHRPFVIGGQTHTGISGSLGLTLFPMDDAKPQDLLRHADIALYEAKGAGKDRYNFFNHTMESEMRRKEEVREFLINYLKDNDPVLYFQPLVDLRTGKLRGMEALSRVKRDGKILSPVEFLSAIEGTHHLLTFDRRVLQQACAQIQQWHNTPLSVPVSVNLAPIFLRDHKSLAFLEGLLEQYPQARGRLHLEILESAAERDLNDLDDFLTGARKLGLPILLDDFGTGASSLVHLERIECYAVKIDQRFVRGMWTRYENHAIITSLSEFCRITRRELVAEGVESPELGLVLLASGLGTMAQGYAIAKPMPPEEMPNWLANWKPPSLWTQAGNYPMLDKALPAILPHLRLLADLRVRTPNKSFADLQVASGGRGRAGRHGKLPPVDNSLALEKSLRTLSCPVAFVEKALKQNIVWQRAFAKANQILIDTGELSDAMIADVDRKTLNLLQTLCRLQSHRGNTAALKPELQEVAT
jgi:diguanylate cyclase (GGDEF)-like protein